MPLADGLLARTRVSLAYRWRHGRWPDLDRPQRFTERVQQRKLFDRNLALASLTDKLKGKEVARERIGGSFVIPTLWSGKTLPLAPPGPLPMIVKANHGCNQSLVIRTARDWDEARRIAPRWLQRAYGQWLDEWHYRSARRLLLIEPFVGPDERLPLDYKFYVFGGRAELVQVHLDRGGSRHRWMQFDRQWRRLSAPDGTPDPAPPATLTQMLAGAERLAAEHDFLRVDFYEIGGRMLFGEFCLFPGSGLDPFDPPSLDHHLGAWWSDPAPVIRPGGRAMPGPVRPGWARSLRI